MSGTLEWLSAQHFVDVAYVLLIDGVQVGFTTRPYPESAVLGAGWDAFTDGGPGSNMKGGLVIQGSIERSIEMFDAEIQASSLKFSLLDYDRELAPLMFGEGRTDIDRTPLVTKVLPSDTTIEVEDVTELAELDSLIHVGLETMGVITTDEGLNTIDVERGIYSLFATAPDPAWARTHEVDMDGDSPDVTTLPTVWYNRPVGLYACHKIGNSWAVGFPHQPGGGEKAALLWAGVIKTWADGGDGWIHLDCEEITTIAKTTVGARVYEGTLEEGVFLEEDDCEFQLRIRLEHVVDSGGVTITEVFGGARYVAQLSSLADTVTSHADAAIAINAALTTALTGANDGVYAPLGMVGELSLEADGRYHLFFTWDDATPWTNADYLRGMPYLWLSPFVWDLLGFNSDRGVLQAAQVAGGFVAPFGAERLFDTVWRSIASEPPKRFQVRQDAWDAANATLYVTPTTDIEYSEQTDGILPGFSAGATGFLMLGEKKIIAVEQTSANEFSPRGLVGDDFRRVQNQGGNILSETNILSEFLWAHDDGGPPIKVRQVWLQPFDTIGEALLTALVSTGENDYNTAYDRLPLGFGAAFPSALIDAASFLAMPAIPFRLIIEKPKPLSQIIESAMNTTGMHVVWANGQFTVVNPLADPEPGLVELDETNKVTAMGDARPDPMPDVVERNPDTIINRITLRHSQRLDGEFAYAETVHARRSQSEHGQVRAKVVDGYGIFQDGADYWIANVASAALLYFAYPVAAGERPCNFNVMARLYPGAQALLSSLSVIDPTTGERGVEDLVVWILGVTGDWMTGIGAVRYCFAPHALREPPEEE